MEEKLYTVQEIANILRLTPATVYDYIRSGRIRSIRWGKRNIRISESSLNEFMGGHHVCSSLDHRASGTTAK